MKPKIFLIIVCLVLISLFACSKEDQDQDEAQTTITETQTVTIMTHDSFSVSKEVVSKFEARFHAKIIILKSGDAGEALNKAILSKNNPLADIFYGVDNTFLSRALDAQIFVPYAPLHLDAVDPVLRLDASNRLVPVDFGDVCLNYDIKWFKEKNKVPPAMLEDLIKPAYKGLTVVENPATSSPGLAFLLATISRFGQDGYIDYWQKLKANEVLVTNGWKEAYWGKFTAASDGDKPIVVSYASSPAAEVFFSETKIDEAPTGIVIENGSAFRQIEFAGILKGTSNMELAKKTMDFILSKDFQEDIPLQMFVFPANKTAELPDVFKKHAGITKEPAFLDPQLIDTKRDVWIREWTEEVLQ
ncbi:thiamine ABC transporter substrate-binding protein [Desulfobacula sp.]|uniref:thiamine ABC transporter substrate-binding protein n=1 Tax=Desulfobacula sp. TaxID=2593537 RepID=UPI00261ECD25|nr:thiamine ABC transporter substrate-binding protein [Desulfobacula sp.]